MYIDISTEIKQPGGVINICKGISVSYVVESGSDSKLGSWVWVNLQGKNSVKTTVLQDTGHVKI